MKSFKSSQIGAIFLFLITTSYAVFEWALPKYVLYKDGKLGHEITLNFHNEKLMKEVPTYFFYAVPVDAVEARYMVPVSLSIQNKSQAQETNANLSICYSKANQRQILTDEFYTHSGIYSASNFSHEINEADDYVYVNHVIKSMPPDGSYSFSDVAFSSPVGFDTNPLFTTGTGMDITVTTFADHDVERHWDIKYRGVRVGDDRGIEQYVRNWYGKAIAIDIREKTGFWHYLYGILFSENIIVYGFSPDFVYFKNLNLYVPRNNPKTYTGYEFNPFTWSLLFDFGKPGNASAK